MSSLYGGGANDQLQPDLTPAIPKRGSTEDPGQAAGGEVGQVGFTNFAAVGYRLQASPQVPQEVVEDFRRMIVDRLWDSYDPPQSGYRGVFIHQTGAGHCLFGWVYHDGYDDLGRDGVPYFLGYYLARGLNIDLLNRICSRLERGPISRIDRHCAPRPLEDLSVAALWDTGPVRDGLRLPVSEQLQLRSQIKEGRLLSLRVDTSARAVPAKSPHPFNLRGRFAGSVAVVGLVVAVALGGTLYGFKRPVVDTVGLTRSRPRPQVVPALSTGRPGYRVRLIKAHAGPVWSVAFSPDGRTLASAHEGGIVRLWQTEDGRLIRVMRGGRQIVRSVAFSPDGRTLASGGGDNLVRLWNMADGRELRVLKAHRGPVWSVAFSPDGQILASGSTDGTVRLWNPEDGRSLHRLRPLAGPVWSVTFSPDGRNIAAAQDNGSIHLWDAVSGRVGNVIDGHTATVRSLLFSPDGRFLASGSWDRTVRIWDWRTRKLERVLPSHADNVVALAFSPRGILASASRDRTVHLWQLQQAPATNSRDLGSLRGHTDWVLHVAFSPIGNTLATAGKDGTIRLWQGS